ncbi:hypothetical protein ACFVVU_22320 [Kitasatospora sp. NPDC057965]|uniref:hypothetical protein n=1 Tax=Kitasatospora sp. NPDC057965 TaxID=3346291 RepID=UPI0036DC24CA
MTAPTTPETAPLTALAASLQATALGHPPTADGALSNPRTATAFGEGARLEPVDLGDGLWAALRTSPDAAQQVLCVHNLAAHPVDFDPRDAFTGAALDDGELLFLAGQIGPAPSGGDAPSRLAPHTYVWLGRFRTAA